MIRKIKTNDRTLLLVQGDLPTPVTIKEEHPLDHSSRMLSVYMNPMGDFSDHIISLKKKADAFSRLITMSPRLTAADISIFHRSIYIPSMRYSLAAVAANEETLGHVQYLKVHSSKASHQHQYYSDLSSSWSSSRTRWPGTL